MLKTTRSASSDRRRVRSMSFTSTINSCKILHRTISYQNEKKKKKAWNEHIKGILNRSLPPSQTKIYALLCENLQQDNIKVHHCEDRWKELSENPSKPQTGMREDQDPPTCNVNCVHPTHATAPKPVTKLSWDIMDITKFSVSIADNQTSDRESSTERATTISQLFIDANLTFFLHCTLCVLLLEVEPMSQESKPG